MSQQIYINEKPVKLDPKAFGTLKLLIANKHRVVNNEELIELVWENRAISNEVIVSAIARIRKLFKSAGFEQEVIRTIHKVGYKFCLDTTEECDDSLLISSQKPNIHKVINLFLFVIIMIGVWYIFELNNNRGNKVTHTISDTKGYDSVPIFEKHPEKNNKHAAQLTQIYFLRHAEKLFDGTDNPHLSDNGIKHAKYWKDFFQHIKFDKIYTTKFHRNIETADIIAKDTTDIIKVYSALSFDIVKHLPEFSGKTILIIAHSNTIPGMINRVVGSNKYEPMSLEDYQSIFQITIDSDKRISSNRFYLGWPHHEE